MSLGLPLPVSHMASPMAILAFLVLPSRYPPASAEPIFTASLMV
jgi:hypothetical protein